MLKKDQVCEKCNWVASYLYDIKGIKYHYCFNCFTQKKSPPIELIFTNKNISKSVTKGGTGDLMVPTV